MSEPATLDTTRSNLTPAAGGSAPVTGLELPTCDDFFKGIGVTSNVPAVTAAVRAYLQVATTHLLAHHDAGFPADKVNEQRAELIDRLIRKLFRVAEDRYFSESPRLNFRIAILAVGGYGRREHSLGSDIDLLFLYRGKVNPYIETIAESLTQRLWDARLTVGMAVRTVPECMRVGREDLSTLTSYLDVRYLAGEEALLTELTEATRAHLRENPGAFVEAKLTEQRARHERYGESLYLLQPNLRESVGGLRDYHTALWVARAVQWEVRRASDLRLHGFIDDAELADLNAALGFVWRLRNELHRKGRKDDRLHYEAQERLARQLGFTDTERSTATESLMRAYYMHARAIERVSRRAADHVRSVLERRAGTSARTAQPVAEGFLIVEGRLEIPRESVITERPLRLLSAFAISQHHDVELSLRAQRLLRQNLHLAEALRTDPEAAAVFRQILSSPTRVYRTLATMDEIGLLGAYIPEFASLVGLWQQDMYHTYTVDVHSLFLVEQLRRLQKGRFKRELPLATALMREVRSPVVLFVGCILHDIGKGHGGGHSEKGAKMTPEVAKRLHLSDEETDTVEFLVRHHLTLSSMAEHRNVHDRRVILRLANLARTRERLRSLYLLTVADIRSVSPEAWTTWKAGLLEALYRNAAEWLETGGRSADADGEFLERATRELGARQTDVLARLERSGADLEKAKSFIETLPPRYLLSHPTDEMAAQVEAGLDFVAAGRKLGVYVFRPSQTPEQSQVAISPLRDGVSPFVAAANVTPVTTPPASATQVSASSAPFWGLVVFARDQPGLMARTAGAISSFGHNILAAQIYTSRESLAFDVFQLSPLSGGPDEEEHERSRIEERLRRVIEDGAEIPVRATTRASSSTLAVRPQPPRVRIANDDSDFYSIVEVEADDRPGLLYDLTRAISEQKLDVVMSWISTRARRITDVFYVTDGGQKVRGGSRRAQIREALLAALERPGT